jgi:hypothetical protein
MFAQVKRRFKRQPATRERHKSWYFGNHLIQRDKIAWKLDGFFVIDCAIMIVWLFLGVFELAISANKTSHAAAGKRRIKTEFALGSPFLDSFEGYMM